MNLLKKSKLVSLNIIFLLLFIILAEILFGNWRKNFLGANKYIQIPHLIKNKTLKYDSRRFFSSKKPVEIVYVRDEFGYRSRDPLSNKPIVLNIGGSTTDERYITEGATWTDILDLKLKKYDFVNGGVDGQSSYGHLISMSNWHSKFFKRDDISIIIFYLGTNDRRLINFRLNDWDLAQSQKSYIKHLLKDNSFFTSNLVILKNKIELFFNMNDNKKNFFGHSFREKGFKKTGIRYELNENLNLLNYPNYKEIFSNLILKTRNSFPNSEIFIIQQQIPGCKFVTKTIVYDRFPDEENNYCFDLLKVYNLQEKILSESPIKKNIKLFPMYLKKIIKDEDVYDYVHTNKKGSINIAKYIESIILQKD